MMAPPRRPGPALLLVGGLDPTGEAGLARDVAACADERMHACPAATGITVQTTAAFQDAGAVDADAVEAQMEAALAESPALWAKVGALFTPEQALAVARVADRHGLNLVLDPVLASSSGRPFLDDAGVEALRRRLLPRAFLATPNAAEARRLTGQEDPQRAAAHLVSMGARAALVTRGGAAPDLLFDGRGLHELAPRPAGGPHRGTGCRLATRIACRLARGVPLAEAVQGAHDHLQRELHLDTQDRQAAGPEREAWQELDAWLPRILEALDGTDVPEVGANVAYALPGATEAHRHVVGLAGRIAIAGGHHAVAGRLAVGGPHHTGRLAVVLQEIAPDARIVMNHRFHEDLLHAARAAGLTAASFRREDEPPDVPSTMEWGLREALRAHRERTGDPHAWPDLVWDRGGPGKEPMVRVLATGPADLVRKLRRMRRRPQAPAVAAGP